MIKTTKITAQTIARGTRTPVENVQEKGHPEQQEEHDGVGGNRRTKAIGLSQARRTAGLCGEPVSWRPAAPPCRPVRRTGRRR